MTTTLTTDAWLDDWAHWHADREAAAAAPHGLASTTGTHWLDAEPTELPTVSGAWSAADGRVVGTDVGTGAADVRLAPGESLELDDLRLLAISRDGVLALRVLDPAAPTRAAFDGIDAFDPDRAWSLVGRFTPAAEQATVTIDNVDGRRGPQALAGTVHVTIDGHEAALSAFPAANGGLQITFADATSGTTTNRFRFLTLPAPSADGTVAVDLNRAYLPPCAFTDHYLCPVPPPENRLPVAVPVGETLVRTTPGRD
ncbi:DUF1684 domain-containing protein [Aeromicrobium alkaliterrae]|uniref:DUF1684 domain-containing protein n=1 Tax=Aeromicrobium alkaliterrae TaxID=302168 RepID=A0ABP4W981_9ACTN